MLVLETVLRIRREHGGGKPIKAIARDLRLSRKVVRKAIRSPESTFDYQRKVQPLPRLGPFQEQLDTLLTQNEALPRRDRLRMTRIHDLLQREGFEGSYDAVRRYARRWAEAQRKAPSSSVPAFIPLMFKPGEAYQFDWSHEDVEIAGKPMRVKVAHRYHKASSHEADQPFDIAFVIALAGAAELVFEQIMALQRAEHLAARPRSVAQYPRHRQFGVIVKDRARYAAEKGKRLHMPITKRLGNFGRIGLEERRIAVRQIHAEIMVPDQLAIDNCIRLAKIDLSMAGPMAERHEYLACAPLL
jgi:hypothetical protein